MYANRRIHKDGKEENTMMTKEFGEVKLIQDEYPVGLILREKAEGVVLEEYFDTTGENVDVLHEFDVGITLDIKTDFYDCLDEARRYEPDFNVPIYIKERSLRTQGEEEKKKCYACMAAYCGIRPYELTPSKEKCAQCHARKSKAEEDISS